MILSIGIRELRQNASRYLRLVEERGEPIEITDRGRPVALLSPLPLGNRIEQLAASGRLKRATQSWKDLGPPLEPVPGVPLPSEVLAAMRADER
ncbi:MAG: type II toxin-antitoxin system prevent-host-death family antitoxin [Actinobacteria bacterium]|nr:type II toxin-antitoxin system prevent-host-death family antitoxin [Actinomycetota bacterium]